MPNIIVIGASAGGVDPLHRIALRPKMSKKKKQPKSRRSASKKGTARVERKQEVAAPASKSLTPPNSIVGIGASAGGLEAFEQVLSALPEDTGMALVLVQLWHPSMKVSFPNSFPKPPECRRRSDGRNGGAAESGIRHPAKCRHVHRRWLPT